MHSIVRVMCVLNVIKYRLILQFEVKNWISFFKISGDLCSLPYILRVWDPDPVVLKKKTTHNHKFIQTVKTLEQTMQRIQTSSSMRIYVPTMHVFPVKKIDGFCYKFEVKLFSSAL